MPNDPNRPHREHRYMFATGRAYETYGALVTMHQVPIAGIEYRCRNRSGHQRPARRKLRRLQVGRQHQPHRRVAQAPTTKLILGIAFQ